MADVVWSVSFPDYKMIYITPSIEKITGFSQSYYLENYVVNRWEEAVYIRDKHLVDKAYKDLEKDGSFEIEVRIRTKDGQLKWVQNKGAIIYDDEGLPVRLDGYISDISERKAQESDLMKYFEVVEGQNERLKNFTYIVSHNVRSHSANIQGLINLIKQLNPDIYKNEYVQMLDISSLRLDDTLHQLNEVISVVSSVQKLKKLKVYEIVENLKNAFSILLNNSEVNLINEIEEDIFVEATPAYLESILTNLITNAIKYSDPNKGSYVKLRSQNINGSVNIFIEDNGLGLDLEKYGSKLFGMYKTFHQHKDARGIGLFLSKNQAESMGGKIEVESKVGIGSTFKLILKNGDI
jgi:PAS domain S-box-containing protein